VIVINIPNNFLPERKYIVGILFNDFLGLKNKILIKQNVDRSEIVLDNQKRLIINDAFFSNFKDSLDYLSKKNIPNKVNFIENQFIPEKDIPVFYGNDELKIEKDEIICGIDIFASSFFMLSRWEEYVNKSRDSHNRFPASESIAFRNQFLSRPIVNEYVEMLWNMLKYLGIKQKRKEKKYQLILTHDIDNIYKYLHWKRIFMRLGGDIIKRKNLKLFYNTAYQCYRVKAGIEKDPFNCFDYLIKKSDYLGVKSRFYFMAGGNSIYDNNYSMREADAIISKIKEKEHIIGFHPSYNSFNNEELWKKEKEKLENSFNLKLEEGRQHYLRFQVPDTWRIWENNGMSIDSTCGYADVEGYRCGTGDEFRVFDIINRQQLKLKERPLIIMEGTLKGKNYRNLSLENAKCIYNGYLNVAKKYQSTLTLLWHNSSFDSCSIWKGWDKLYDEVIVNPYSFLDGENNKTK